MEWYNWFNFLLLQIKLFKILHSLQTSRNIICRKDKIYEVFSLNFFNQYLNSIYESLSKFNYMKVLIYFERFKYNTRDHVHYPTLFVNARRQIETYACDKV